MVLINIYGKINPIIISRKLGVGICNPASDWIEGFHDDFDEEILIYKHDMKKFLKDGFNIKSMEGRYNLPQIVKNVGWQEEGKSVEQVIAEHLIEIRVIDFENSLLQKNNGFIDSPTCEIQYTKKFIKFCSIVENSECAQRVLSGQIPFVTYDSNDYNSKPLILNYLQVISNLSIGLDEYSNNCIMTLQHLGGLIDGFLSTDEDYWLFNYIINVVSDNHGKEAYHIFKVMSLIEMMIINPNGNGRTSGEMERKLPQFLSIDIDSTQKELFSTIMRKLRNKIGHGDFKAIQQLLEDYRNSFMQNFWYDEFEYSIENWTYGNICIELDKALANILWLMLFDKEKLLRIQQN
jgi:hypothetical protein